MIKLNGAAGTNLSLDRELFLRNRFSEDLLSCEDIELFIKLRRMKGVVILLEPRAVVYHLHPNSLQELFAQRKWYGKGSVNFYRKYWHTTFKRDSILNTSNGTSEHLLRRCRPITENYAPDANSASAA
jgi:cellulose synthase/poly-beta-1,6-N-acetylglucosamine synthase-like glycosyltransferase